MFNIGSLVSSVVKKAGIKDEVKGGQAINYFKELKDSYLGEDGESVKVMYLKNNCLVIACLSDEIVEKLKENEGEILSKINNRFGEGRIRNINYLT